jgi:hypothetical protein
VLVGKKPVIASIKTSFFPVILNKEFFFENGSLMSDEAPKN